jgi:hypothetical protein
MRTAGPGRAPQGRAPGGELPWSLATSYKRCEVVFVGAGRTCFCSQPFSGPAVTNHNQGVAPWSCKPES